MIKKNKNLQNKFPGFSNIQKALTLWTNHKTSHCFQAQRARKHFYLLVFELLKLTKTLGKKKLISLKKRNFCPICLEQIDQFAAIERTVRSQP